MIKDLSGKEITYWPIPNLVEGQNSEVLTIRIDTPIEARLRANSDPRIKFWAKWMAFPNNPFIEVSTGAGISLSGIPAPYAEFEIYVEALSPINSAFERVPITLFVVEGHAAGWLT